MTHRLDRALQHWAQMLAEQMAESLTVGEVESRQIAEAELAELSQQTFLAATFRHQDHPNGEWQLLLSSDEAELLARLQAGEDSDKTLEGILEATCRTWVGQLAAEFSPAELPTFVGVTEMQPAFFGNLRTQLRVPLLVEGEPFFELKAILDPALYESLRRKQIKAVEEPRDSRFASSVVFEPLARKKNLLAGGGDLGLILDVPLELTVVLGCTTVMLDELIRLGEGSVLELDKLAGEPVELYVKDRLVGLAEVVVSDERFAIRVLEMFDAPRRYRTSPFPSQAAG